MLPFLIFASHTLNLTEACEACSSSDVFLLEAWEGSTGSGFLHLWIIVLTVLHWNLKASEFIYFLTISSLIDVTEFVSWLFL